MGPSMLPVALSVPASAGDTVFRSDAARSQRKRRVDER